MDLGTYFEEFTRRDWQTIDDGTVRIAIVGLGGFARDRALPAMQDGQLCEATVLVSSSQEKAAALADDYGVERTITYDAFHDGEAAAEYDAIYVATPPAFHREYAETAANLGKHILCEKPLAADLDDARRMVEVSAEEGIVLMTAYRLRTEPAIRRMRDVVRDGVIGDPVQVHGGFSSKLLDHVGPDSWRLDPNIAGGGALMDLGVYPLNTTRFLLDAAPVAVRADTVSSDPPFDRVEGHVSVTLSFPSGTTACCTASFDAHGDSHIQILGTDGLLSVRSPFGGYIAQEIVVERGETRTEYTGPTVDEVCEEFDYFANCILDDGAGCESDGEEGLTDLRIIESAYESAESGTRISL